MDVNELYGQIFEWDAEKAAANLRKHRVSFEKACEFGPTGHALREEGL